MKKTPIQAAAVAIKAAMQGQAVTVVATSDTDLLSADSVHTEIADMELTEHTCASCETKVNASAYTPNPFCPTCGSTDMAVTAKKVTASFASDDDLVGVQCSGCGVTNVLDVKAVKACNGIHCTACGVRLTADADAIDAPEPVQLENQSNNGKLKAPPTSEDDLVPDVNKVKSEADEVEELDQFADGMTDDVEAGLDDNFDFSGSDDLDDVSDVDLGMDLDGDDDLAAPVEDTLGVEDFSLDADLTDNDVEVTVGDELRIEPEVTPMLTEGEPVIDAMDFDDGTTGVSFMEIDNLLVACKGSYSVAVLKPNKLQANADLVMTQAFPSAVLRAANKQGLRRALKAFKFDLLCVPTVSQATVKAKVQAASVESKKQLEKQQAAFAESLAIAAVGMSRNLWKGVKNPLQASIATEMARLGHRAPNRVAASIFAAQGVEFSRTLTHQAMKLAAMSDSAREEFASMLDMTEQVPVDLADANDADLEVGDTEEVFATDDMADDQDLAEFGDDPSLNLTARLARPSSSVFRPSQSPALLRASTTRSPVAVQASTEVQAILAGTARLSFD